MIHSKTDAQQYFPLSRGIKGAVFNQIHIFILTINFLYHHIFMSQASPENNYLYNPHLKEKARKLRSEMTKAEACLWKYVLQGLT